MHHRLISDVHGDNDNDQEDYHIDDGDDDDLDEVENEEMVRVDQSCLAHLSPSSPA